MTDLYFNIGHTISLAYAEQDPAHVSEMVLFSDVKADSIFMWTSSKSIRNGKCVATATA